MISKDNKLREGLVQVSTAQYREMFGHFRDQMGTISFGLADLSMDLQALMKSLHRWEAAFDAFQDIPAKPSKKQQRTAKPRTSTRQRASCWQGEFYCEDYKTASIKHMPRGKLEKLALEHSCYWLTDEELANK